MTWNINGLRACLRRRFNGKLINLLNFLDAGVPPSRLPYPPWQVMNAAQTTALHIMRPDAIEILAQHMIAEACPRMSSVSGNAEILSFCVAPEACTLVPYCRPHCR